MKINGVNLGNWLVLEKWMNPALFADTDAEDEAYLVEKLPTPVYEARMKTHRAEYITERDFLHIWSMGFNTVRIPVPYYIFGDRKPFIGCIEELDKAFNWAENYNLKILIDLHTAPESQNGFDNGGLCGIVKWATLPHEVDFELTVLERLAKRYGQRKGLFGIEVLNEPLTPQIFEHMKVWERYPPVDKKRAEGTCPVEWDFLEDFYLKAYDLITPHMAEDKYVVIHDGFDILHWKNFMQEEKYKRNVILDTHNYLMGMEYMDCDKSLEGHLKFIKENFEKNYLEMTKYHKLICGEWCLFNILCAKLNNDNKDLLEIDDDE
jgi:aryl-phospho-beta-D-glucosidase BglC (GH1 family)